MSTPFSVPGIGSLRATVRPSKYSFSATSDWAWTVAADRRIVAMAARKRFTPTSFSLVVRRVIDAAALGEYCIQNTNHPPRDLMLQRTPLRDEVYRHLLDRVYTGHLPAGTRVKDTDVARDLGVSRTPVREALLRLAREGVLRADAGRGFQVRHLDGTEMRETGSVLSALEC